MTKPNTGALPKLRGELPDHMVQRTVPANSVFALARSAGATAAPAEPERQRTRVQTPEPEGASTPPTAARAAKGAAGKARQAGKKGKVAPAMKYRRAATGETWTGRGLRPAWVKAHLAAGGTLAELETAPAAQKVKDDAGCAGDGGEPVRDPNTADMFEAEAH